MEGPRLNAGPIHISWLWLTRRLAHSLPPSHFSRSLKDHLDRAVKGSEVEELSANAIEQRMSRLRRILDQADAGVRITTIRGPGYVLEPKRTAHFANPSHALDAARET